MFKSIAAIMAMLTALNGAPAETHYVYMRAMEVKEINIVTDVVSCEDAVGFKWEFYGVEDYAVGDFVVCLMDTMGTDDTILDDAIVMVNYSGYYNK